MKPNVGRPPNPPTNLNSVKPRIPTNGPIKPSSGSLQKRASEVVPSSTKGRSIEKKLPVGGSSSKIETVSTVKPNFITKNIASSKVPKSSLKGSIPAKDWKLDWAGLPEGVYVQIFQFVCKTVWDVFKLLHVCRGWREVVQGQGFQTIWERLKVRTKVANTRQLTVLAKQLWIDNLIRSYGEFEKTYVRLFDYGSTKENIANKLLAKLNLQLHIKINKLALSSVPYKLRSFNFSSYLVFKCTDVNTLKFDFNSPPNLFKDKITLELTFESRKYKASHTIRRQYFPEQIYDMAIRQKAFNYYLDKNLVFTMFEGDSNFLYLLGEYSAVELLAQFRREIKRQQKIRQLELTKQKKKLCEDFQYESFSQYFRFQADFQLHMSFHNSEKQIFTHCDTKVFPVEYNDKQAFFKLQINDSFPVQKTFKLDNKMGMSQSVQDLYLLDLVLKDRDRFLVTFSGFIYARQLGQEEKSKLDNFMRLVDFPVFELSFKSERYAFELAIVQEKDRYFLPTLQLHLYPQKH